jgi:hypothetical protein
MMDPSVVVPVLSQPSRDAPAIGRASALVIVVSPLKVVDGYVAVLQFNGTPGWVAGRFLKPWKDTPVGPRQTCVPSVMSNGRIGFDFRDLPSSIPSPKSGGKS